jgi:hypothetical protein
MLQRPPAARAATVREEPKASASRLTFREAS